MMEMSRSKQDELLLEARIEKIRKKNEEIKRRHLEVEADKQHAAKLNALVKMTSPTEDWPIGGKLAAAGEEKLDDIRPFERNPEATEWPPKRSKSPQRNQAQARPRRSEPYKSVQNVASGNIGGAKCFNLGQGDGPPPDPKYKFLADSERDGDINISPSDRRQTRPSRGRGSSPGGDSGGVGGGGNFRGGGRGASRRGRPYRGGCQSHGESEPSHAEYEAWRAERNRIDNDRINRQKTAEGHWRREWDNEKISQEDDEPPMSQVSRFSGPRRGNSWGPSQDYSQHTTHSLTGWHPYMPAYSWDYWNGISYFPGCDTSATASSCDPMTETSNNAATSVPTDSSGIAVSPTLPYWPYYWDMSSYSTMYGFYPQTDGSTDTLLPPNCASANSSVPPVSESTNNLYPPASGSDISSYQPASENTVSSNSSAIESAVSSVNDSTTSYPSASDNIISSIKSSNASSQKADSSCTITTNTVPTLVGERTLNTNLENSKAKPEILPTVPPLSVLTSIPPPPLPPPFLLPALPPR